MMGYSLSHTLPFIRSFLPVFKMFKSLTLAVLAAALASAAPTQTSTATLDTTASAVLSKASVSKVTNVASAGPVVPYSAKCPLPVKPTTTPGHLYSPKFTYPLIKGNSFIDWKTYKVCHTIWRHRLRHLLMIDVVQRSQPRRLAREREDTRPSLVGSVCS